MESTFLTGWRKVDLLDLLYYPLARCFSLAFIRHNPMTYRLLESQYQDWLPHIPWLEPEVHLSVNPALLTRKDYPKAICWRKENA